MNWKKVKTKRKHRVAKNKNLEAVLITKDNVAEVEKDTGVFLYIENTGAITAGLGFYRLPPVSYTHLTLPTILLV